MQTLKTLRTSRSTLRGNDLVTERMEMIIMQTSSMSSSTVVGSSNGADGLWEKGKGRSLAELPGSVLLRVLECCEPVDAWALSQTCSTIRSLAKAHEELWEECMRQLCASRHIQTNTFVSLAIAAKRSINFANIVSGHAPPNVFRPGKVLPASRRETILGLALAEGGRWLVTRSRREVHAWDLRSSASSDLPEQPTAVFDLDGGTVTGDDGSSLAPLERVLQLSQGDDANILLHVPHLTNKRINSQVLKLDTAGSPPSFRQLRSLLGNDIPPGSESFSFHKQLVATEYETAITIWNWEKDAWITFTQDNFFDAPACPAHTSVQLHLVPPYILTAWGGEVKLFEIPPLRPRRPKGKPAFVTVPALWSVRLPHAPNLNPRVGRVLKDISVGNKLLHLALIFQPEAGSKATVHFWRLPSLPSSDDESKQIPTHLPPITLDGVDTVPATLVGGSVHRSVWAVLPIKGQLLLLRSGISEPSRTSEMCHLSLTAGEDVQVSMCHLSGKVALLDRTAGSIVILELPSN